MFVVCPNCRLLVFRFARMSTTGGVDNVVVVGVIGIMSVIVGVVVVTIT